jgi:hypothetical protein
MNDTAIVPAGGRDDDTTALLSDLRKLRTRARLDRQAHAFPLLLFGALILAAPLLYTPAAEPEYSHEGWDPRVEGGNLLERVFRTTALNDPAHPTLIAWYWLLVLVGGFGATLWWYRRRATRVGVGTDTKGLVIATVAAFAGFFLGTFAFTRYALSLYGAWQVNLSLMFGSLLAAALILWWNRKPLGLFLAAVFGAVTFSSIAVYTNKGFSALLVIAGGLLVLTWLERSVSLGVVSVLFTMAAVPATAMVVTPYLRLDMPLLFANLGWTAGWENTQLLTLQELILPAAVLIAGGTIAALRHRGKEVTR